MVYGLGYIAPKLLADRGEFSCSTSVLGLMSNNAVPKPQYRGAEYFKTLTS